MSVRYEYSESLQVLAEDIIRRLFPNLETSRVKCFRSYDSGLSNVARCYSLNELMQKSMDCKPFYSLEFVSEKFNDMNTEEKVKVVIHLLMHASGVFTSDVISDNLDYVYSVYLGCRKNDEKKDIVSLVRNRD